MNETVALRTGPDSYLSTASLTVSVLILLFVPLSTTDIQEASAGMLTV